MKITLVMVLKIMLQAVHMSIFSIFRNAASPTEYSGAARPVASTPILDGPSVEESPAERPAKNVDGWVKDPESFVTFYHQI